jgi:hypothetical protein
MSGSTEQATSAEDEKLVDDLTEVDPTPEAAQQKVESKTQAERERDARRALKAAVKALRQLGKGKYTLFREEVEDIQRRFAGELEARPDV